MMILYTHMSGALVPLFTFPLNTKQKYTYFVRKKEEMIVEENIAEMLLIGDMSPKPVDELAILIEEVFVPLLMNPKNQVGWPSVVCEDVASKIQNFNNILYQVRIYITITKIKL